jgi:hypothetical protein
MVDHVTATNDQLDVRTASAEPPFPAPPEPPLPTPPEPPTPPSPFRPSPPLLWGEI